MSRYLTDCYLRGAVSRGRTVEQFLGGFVHEEEPAIRWACATTHRLAVATIAASR